MADELTAALRDIALGKTGQAKSIEQSQDSRGYTMETKRIEDAIPNPELIMELIDRQIGGEKDWC